jgi:serine/threonine protein kinase
VKTPAILQAFQNQILPADAQLLQADDPVEIGGHRLAGRLLSSGAGVVYLARDRAGGLVTVKTTHSGTADPGPVRARLCTEAACAGRLPAASTARLLHDGTDRTPPYLVSEYVEGPSLERVIDVKGPLPSAMVGALAAALAETLAAVHDAGVVHGNLTPANVLLTKDGLRVIDFGVAQEISTSGEPAEIGAVADNPGWLAPELLTGGPPAPACDIFGWGCLVTYAATGHSPHGATPLDTEALEEPVRGLVDAAVAEDHAARPTAAELTARLTDAARAPAAERVEEHVIPAVRRPRRVRSRAVLSALLTVGALLFAVPTTTHHRSAAPPPPRALGPVAPPKKAQPPKRASNAAAMSVDDAPSAGSRGDRSAAPKATPSSPSHGKIWMSCSSKHPGWCSLSQTPPDDPSGWQFSWTPGG